MTYKTDLNWFKEIQNFRSDEQKVLLALSNEKYKWRTKDRLVVVTGLSDGEVDSILSSLISKGYVRPSISKKKHIIFGLRERVG